MAVQRAGVGEAGQFIGLRGTGGALKTAGVLNGGSRFGSDGEHQSFVVSGEGIGGQRIEGDDTDQTRIGTERHGEARAQSSHLLGVVQIAGLNRRISIDDGRVIFRYPAGQAMPHGNFQGRKQTIAFAAYKARNQLLIPQQVNRQSIVPHRFLQADRKQSQSIVDAERIAQIVDYFVE